MRRALLGILVGAVGYGLIFRAEAQGVQAGTGLVCDQAEQVEAVGALFSEKGNQGAIDAINEKEKDACGILTVAYVVVAEKGRIKVGNKYYKVVQIEVVAVANNGQWRQLSKPLVQYTAVEVEERPA